MSPGRDLSAITKWGNCKTEGKARWPQRLNLAVNQDMAINQEVPTAGSTPAASSRVGERKAGADVGKRPGDLSTTVAHIYCQIVMC